MNTKNWDVLVAKEFITSQSGTPEPRTVWNKVGRAWPSKSGESLSFELYLFPNIRYTVQLKDKHSSQIKKSNEEVTVAE